MAEEKFVNVGVGIWVFNPRGQVLFSKRLSKHGTGTWAPPGGKMEVGEKIEECAARELFEETGIEIPAKQFQIIDFTNDIFPNSHYVTIHLFAENITAKPVTKEPTKHEKWQWLNINNLPKPLFVPAENLLKKIKEKHTCISR